MITRLYVNNYRCFVNFELRPGRSGLLLGYNGVGKSSVFDVLGGVQDLVIWNKDATEAFPSTTLSSLGNSPDQRFELDVESQWGTLRYALHLQHDPTRAKAAITSEEVTLDGKPLYRYAGGEVHLYDDEHKPTSNTFPYAPRQSFLASLEPKSINLKVSWLRHVLAGIWILRLNPARMFARTEVDEGFLERDASNFASWSRHLLTEAPEGVQSAQEQLREIIPGFVSVRMQALGRAKVLVAKFQDPAGATYELDFDDLSDGQRVLVALYMLLHSVARSATVLCLDEPDNFVFTREIQPLLIELDNLVDDGKVQVLLISHSSEVIDYLGASRALLLERPEGGHAHVGSIEPQGPLRLSELMARGWHAAS